MGKSSGGVARNSNIELLRMVSMVMIVFHHFAVHGGFQFDNGVISVPRLWILFIRMGGKIGVDVFVLISGYYLINSNKKIIDIGRALKFWGQVFFYSIGIYFLFGVLGKIDLDVKSLLRAVFPITFSSYWFASAYFVLYLLHPFLNKFLRGLEKSGYQKMLLLLFTCWCLIPTFTMSDYQGNSLTWFICLYSLAGYIRLFGLNPRIQCMHYFISWIAFSLFTYLLSVVFLSLGRQYAIFAKYSTYLFEADALPVLCISVSLFMAFETRKIYYCKWINTFASTVFGIYLIHDNRIVRYFLWRDVFKNSAYQESAFVIVYSLMAVIIVYALCAMIELIRASTIEKIYLRIIDKYVEGGLKSLAQKCCGILQLILGK